MELLEHLFSFRCSSDKISIDLTMLQGTNEMITDSIISEIEKVAWEINEEYTGKQLSHESVVQNIIKRIGPGSANGSLDINLLPGEARDFSSPEITDAIRTSRESKWCGKLNFWFGW